MASLTPLSKGLIGLAVVGAMASAVWHLVLKERFGAAPTSSTAPSTSPDTPTSSVISTPPSTPPTASEPAARDSRTASTTDAGIDAIASPAPVICSSISLR